MKDFRLSPAFRQACREDVERYCSELTKKYVLLVVYVHLQCMQCLTRRKNARLSLN